MLVSNGSIPLGDNNLAHSNQLNNEFQSNVSTVQKVKTSFGIIEEDFTRVNEKLAELSSDLEQLHKEITAISSTSSEYQQLLRGLLAVDKNYEQLNRLSKCFSNFNHEMDIILPKKSKCERIIRDLLETAEMHQKMLDATSCNDGDDLVYLNVGGFKCEALVKTLIKIDESIFFSKILSEKWNPKTNSESQRIFIDRDGELFKYILKYLRSSRLHITDANTQRELLLEAEFYGFSKMADYLSSAIQEAERQRNPVVTENIPNSPSYRNPYLPTQKQRYEPISPLASEPSKMKPFVSGMSSSYTKFGTHPAQTAPSWRYTGEQQQLKLFINSKLITSEYEQKLIEFLNLDDQIKQKPWRLIYRASEHGHSASDFHRYCDSVSPTLCVIETETGHIFGGYTSVSWSSSNMRSDKTDSMAFLFTLKNTIGVEPTKYPIAKEFEHFAISLNPTCGPNFGSPNNNGSDICLRGNFNEKLNCVFFPRSYVDENKHGAQVFGKRNFICRELEVFST